MPYDEWSEFPFLIAGDNGKAICFLHGFLGGKEDWMPVVRQLSRDYFCLSFDLPGHGESADVIQLPPYEELPDMLERQRKRLGVEQWIVAGYSMGGRIGLNYALRFPDSVSKLIMISASPGIEDDEKREARVASDAAWADQLMTNEAFDFLLKWYDQRVFKSLKKNERLARILIEKRSNYSASHMAQAFDLWGQGKTTPLWSGLASIKVPVLAVAGREDDVYCEYIERMQAISPHVSGVVVENTGHTVHLEQPKQLAVLIDTFIKNEAGI